MTSVAPTSRRASSRRFRRLHLRPRRPPRAGRRWPDTPCRRYRIERFSRMPASPSTVLDSRHRRLTTRAFPRSAIDALVVSHPANLRYLTNHVGTAGLAVVTRRGIELLVDFRYLDRGRDAARRRRRPARICTCGSCRAATTLALVECLESLGVRRGAGSRARTSAWRRHDAWETRLRGTAACRSPSWPTERAGRTAAA